MLYKLLLLISTALLYVHGYGELYILKHPKGVYFKGHQRLYESELPEVYSLALGFSVEHGSSWTGMYLRDPFNLAESVVTVSVDGIPSLEGIGHNFLLKTDADDDETFYALKQRIEDHNPVGDSKIVNIDLSEGLKAVNSYEFLYGIKHLKKSKDTVYFLKYNIEEHRNFLHEINLLNSITDEIESGALKHDLQPDYFRFRCRALHAVCDLHGDNSSTTNEAKKLLVEAINRLSEAFEKTYGSKQLFTVVTSDVSHTRRVRSATQPQATDDVAKLNLAETYSSDYPVIFNIILWFSVAMVFSLLAICMVLGYMDPGRDSIIYRMTSTRMKKDN